VTFSFLPPDAQAPQEAQSLKKEDYELLAEFRYLLRCFLRFSERAALQYQLAPQQYQALLAIEGYPGRNHVTIGELADRLQIAHHSAVGLVDRMEKNRLVRRAPEPGDGRKVSVSLTPEGHRFLENIYRLHREELRSVGPRLGELLRTAADTLPGGKR